MFTSLVALFFLLLLLLSSAIALVTGAMYYRRACTALQVSDVVYLTVLFRHLANWYLEWILPIRIPSMCLSSHGFRPGGLKQARPGAPTPSDKFLRKGLRKKEKKEKERKIIPPS